MKKDVTTIKIIEFVFEHLASRWCLSFAVLSFAQFKVIRAHVMSFRVIVGRFRLFEVIEGLLRSVKSFWVIWSNLSQVRSSEAILTFGVTQRFKVSRGHIIEVVKVI